jgi:hypothetical protein
MIDRSVELQVRLEWLELVERRGNRGLDGGARRPEGGGFVGAEYLYN